MSETTMRAIRVHAYGPPDQLQLEVIRRPQPQAGEVLVRIHAAGVLPIDCAIRQGRFAEVFPMTFPYIPGTAFAGIVEEVGPGVTAFQAGDALCGRSPGGSYAEYATLYVQASAEEQAQTAATQPAQMALVAHKPPSLTFEEAATLSAGATTAWTALFEDGQLESGQRALIHGAAGGVGLFAVQLARWKGAQVLGTASAGNLEFVRELGAEVTIDYAADPFEEAAREVDFVLDTIGGETLRRSMHIVRPGGTVVSIVEEPPAELADSRGIRALKNAVVPTTAHLQQVVELIESHGIRPVVQAVFPLEEAARAHALCETRHGRGRIVLRTADS